MTSPERSFSDCNTSSTRVSGITSTNAHGYVLDHGIGQIIELNPDRYQKTEQEHGQVPVPFATRRQAGPVFPWAIQPQSHVRTATQDVQGKHESGAAPAGADGLRIAIITETELQLTQTTEINIVSQCARNSGLVEVFNLINLASYY